MLPRVLVLFGLLLAGGFLAVGGSVLFRDQLRPPAPPPMTFLADDSQAPEFAEAADSVRLRAAGVQFLLPKGTRIHRQTMKRSEELVSLQARQGGLLFHASFYVADHGILGRGYLQAAKGLADPEMVPVLFGQGPPLMSRVKQLPGGTLLQFDLKNDLPGRRRSLMVAIPEAGPGLATLTIDYPFDPGTGLIVNRVAGEVSFSSGDQPPAG